ncbi:MAG: glycosyltransferase [Pseudonocardia sp.]|nr:glycosyltransferase [Pseudonocardia sp.]
MRVLHVITGLDAGGAEQWLRVLLRYSRDRADVVALSNPGVLAEALRGDGVRVSDLGMRGNSDLAALPRLVGHIRRGRYDVVHTHLFRAQLYGGLAARLAGVRTVVSTEHSLNATLIEGRPTNRPGVRALYRAGSRLATRTVAVSGSVAERLAEWGVDPRRVVMIPVGIDKRAFAFDGQARRRAREPLGLPAGAALVGGVGRLVASKRFDVLVRALAGIPDAHLALVGDGPARPELAALAARLGVRDRVHFLGELLDVAPMLSAMDVFASPSPEETFGVAILEALAAGLPVVYVRCPALDGVGDPGPATSAGPTADAFGHELGAALSRPGTDRSAPAVVDVYDAARSAGLIDDLYRHLVPRPTGGDGGGREPETMGTHGA